VAFEQPVFVEVVGELADAGAQLLEGVEALDPEDLLLDTPDQLDVRLTHSSVRSAVVHQNAILDRAGRAVKGRSRA
jgi:hypothetical protein